MRTKTYFIAISFLILFIPITSCDVLLQYAQQGNQGLTSEEITNGLKTALKEGTKYASNKASDRNGYLKNPVADIKIPLPAPLAEVKSRVEGIPVIEDEVDNLIVKMNRAAENAASKAQPIFIDAITSMTIRDARDILHGHNTAATDYLKNTTSNNLENAFQPSIKSALEDVGAARVYGTVVQGIKKYNQTPLVQEIDINVEELPALEQYVTERAISGLFVLVAREEQNIREDPMGRSEEILRKVFGSV